MGRVDVSWVATVICHVANEDDFKSSALADDFVLPYCVVNDPLKHDMLL